MVKSYIKAEYGPPADGEKRTMEYFAWFPTKITTYKGEHEGRVLTNYYWVWLEGYKVDQEYSECWKKTGIRNLWARGWLTKKIYQ